MKWDKARSFAWLQDAIDIDDNPESKYALAAVLFSKDSSPREDYHEYAETINEDPQVADQSRQKIVYGVPGL